VGTSEHACGAGASAGCQAVTTPPGQGAPSVASDVRPRSGSGQETSTDHQPGAAPAPPNPFSACVFCGSRSGTSPAYRAAARVLGAGIARRGWRLVYGGGEVGLMGEVALASLAGGGEVLGIIPQRLVDREVGKRDLTELVVTRTMFERKERMLARSDAFLVLPGGFGTLDELLEVVTLTQLGYLSVPLVLIDIEGIWAPLRSAFRSIVEHGFAEPTALDLITYVPDSDAALALLDRYVTRAYWPRRG
jgi:uncharacterized protein (TIGR00730 family)